MINVKNLDKTYYKGKSNEIHVINDTTLTLPDTGLVCFLGASGSGKTTLLNTIGGLDKANKGTIDYGDVSFSKYSMSKMDNFRSKSIGYIFQNYLLLEHLTVYENLRIALELIGITDKDEVSKRIEYVLKAVGLYRFRKKPAGQLSGGQQQRVSIARALIKKTRIIIADEPTGNLDSENTIEVMNILKKISKEALVLVVTHNNEIAEFYADKIVKLKDGVVESSLDHVSSGSLESQNDNKIHLLDLNSEDLSTERLNVELYSDDHESKHNITIVIKNNTIYIDSPSRVQLVNGSSVSLVKDHYKKLESTEIKDFVFDTSWYNDTVTRTGVKDFFHALGSSFVNFYTNPKRKKFFSFVFVLIGVVIATLVLLQTNYMYVDYGSVTNEPNLYVAYKDEDYYWDRRVKESDMIEACSKGYVNEIYTNSVSFNIKVHYNSVNGQRVSLHNFCYPASLIENKSMLVGRLPENPHEIVLGKAEADYLIEELDMDYTYSQLIGLTSDFGDYSICGVSSVNTNSIYAYQYLEMYGYAYFNKGNIDCRSKFDTLKIVGDDAHDITADNEILLSEDSYIPIGTQYAYKDKIYTVVGHFTYNYYTSGVNVITTDYNLLGCYFEDGFYKENTDYEPPFIPKGYFDYDIVLGEDAAAIGECVVSAYSPFEIGASVNGCKVVGKFLAKNTSFEYTEYGNPTKDNPNGFIVTSKEDCTRRNVSYIGDVGTNYLLSIPDINSAKTFFEGKGYKVSTVYDYNAKNVEENTKAAKRMYPIIEAILLGVILVYTYFSERATMISEVYDIGVLRSLGAKRKKIVRKSIMDTFAKATLTTLLGYVVTVVLYYFIAIQINGLVNKRMMAVNPVLILLGILILYVSQILVGILPYVFLLRKTPSEINSKYDI